MIRDYNHIIYLYLLFIFILFVFAFTLISSCKKLDLTRVLRLKTGEVTNITETSADIKGIVQDQGEAEISLFGHCWSNSGKPDIYSQNKTESHQTTSAEINSHMDSLLPGTTYYVRAYAIYGGEEIYGDVATFETNAATTPTVTTLSISNITDTSATCGGEVTSEGGYPVTARGICWSTSKGPTVSDSNTVNGSGIGSFTSNLTGLIQNTEYHVRAYAINSEGTGYGTQYSFTTNDVITINWQKSYGGSGNEWANSVQQTADNGYIIAGYSSSDDGDVTGNHGSNDYWIVKLTSAGEIDWQKCLGGSSNDLAYSIQQTTDGGYIIAGASASNDGDVTGNHGNYDYWIVKLTSTGNINWQKSFGGSSDELAYSVQQTTDGGYIAAGKSYSDNGDVTGNHGDSFDFWIVKLTAAGDIDWQKSLGGTEGDYAQSIQETNDGGFIVAGYSNSNDGDVSGNHGSNDYWIVKLTSTGEIDWQKSLGGSRGEYAQSIQETTDGGYIVAGISNSDDGDVTGVHGSFDDYWIVKLNSTGIIDWQKSLGGNDTEQAILIQQTSKGGYIVAGRSRSNNGDVTGNHGSYDSWIVKLTSAGNVDWQRSLGGSNADYGQSIQETNDGSFIVAGYSKSDDGDVSGNHGDDDYWIVKITEN